MSDIEFLQCQNKQLKEIINTFFILSKDIVKDGNIILDIPTTAEESLKYLAVKISNNDYYRLKELVEHAERCIDRRLLEELKKDGNNVKTNS